MKLNKKISTIVASITILTALSTNFVNADDKGKVELNNEKVKQIRLIKKECLDESIEKLKSEKILSDEDVKNIYTYLETKKQEREAGKNNKSNKKGVMIDKMVEDKVITEDQGAKLKEEISTRMQEKRDDIKKIKEEN